MQENSPNEKPKKGKKPIGVKSINVRIPPFDIARIKEIARLRKKPAAHVHRELIYEGLERVKACLPK